MALDGPSRAVSGRRGFLAGAVAAGVFARAGGVRAAPEGGGLRDIDVADGSPRVLVFDVFGTIVDFRTGLIAEAERIGRSAGLTADWPAFADAWARAYPAAIARVRGGGRPWARLDVLLREALDELAGRFGLAGLSERDRTGLVRAWQRLPPWPDAVGGLALLRRRFVLAPLSNAGVAMLVRLSRHAGLPWDCILSAELARRYKPAPEVYRLAPDLLGVAPSDVMMVAAHPGDLDAAAREGLRTAYVHRPLEWGEGNGTEPPPAGRFDVHASDFSDLARRLERPFGRRAEA